MPPGICRLFTSVCYTSMVESYPSRKLDYGRSFPNFPTGSFVYSGVVQLPI